MKRREELQDIPWDISDGLTKRIRRKRKKKVKEQSRLVLNAVTTKEMDRVISNLMLLSRRIDLIQNTPNVLQLQPGRALALRNPLVLKKSGKYALREYIQITHKRVKGNIQQLTSAKGYKFHEDVVLTHLMDWNDLAECLFAPDYLGGTPIHSYLFAEEWSVTDTSDEEELQAIYGGLVEYYDYPSSLQMHPATLKGDIFNYYGTKQRIYHLINILIMQALTGN